MKIGEVESWVLPRLDIYWLRAEAWHRSTRKVKRQFPRGVPVSIAPMFVEAVDDYVNPDGPAVCFQITGKVVSAIKADLGMRGKWGNAYWFGGHV